MAAQSFLPTVPNTPLSNGLASHEGSNKSKRARLPSGACRFTPLSAAGGGPIPQCGCQRYWDKASGYDESGSTIKSGFCMCEHHACYHDHGPDTASGNSFGGLLAVRSSSSTVRPASTALQVHKAEGNQSDTVRDEVHTQVGSTIPDTLQWSRFVHSGSPEGLPPIPSQCLLPSDNGSGTSDSQSRYHLPFGGTGLGTLDHIKSPSSRDAPDRLVVQKSVESSRALQVYQDAPDKTDAQSRTSQSASQLQVPDDMYAPERRLDNIKGALERIVEEGSQLKKLDSQVQVKHCFSNPGPNSPTADGEPTDQLVTRFRNMVDHLSNYPTAVKDHERRLDLLENASFCITGVEDLHEEHGLLEVRISEVEARLKEVEKLQAAQNDASSVISRNNFGSSLDSATSSAMIAAAMDRIEPTRIQALEAQLAELEASAPPSHSRPWEVEVVFIPFGTDLTGLWSCQETITQRSTSNSTTPDDWTQTQSSSMAAVQACLSSRNQRSAWERSTTDFADDQDSSWLMARACSPQSKIFARLKSRGLVRMVQITGPDARDVQGAINAAFGDLPARLLEDPFTDHDNAGTIPDSHLNYLGLQASWIPLRKLHKDSCLRFLNTSEMITPALWNAAFLKSSVAMRGPAPRRLYITQRDSYIQHLGSDTAEWTWQKLRQLPRVYSQDHDSNHTPEADANEPCWELDERLDPPPVDFNASFESHISSLSIRSIAAPEEDYEPESPSDHFSSAPLSRNNSTTPTSCGPPAQRPISPLKERNPFRRPIRTRTISMPSLVPIRTSPSQTSSKRRISSFDYEPRSSPTRTASGSNISAILKRRRISRSPSRPPLDTPRWSTGPPSPYAFAHHDNNANTRGKSPFAYATPPSNAPYIDTRPHNGVHPDNDEEDDGDAGSGTDEFEPRFEAEESQGWEQNALSDFEPGSDAEEEWQGVQDEEVDGIKRAFIRALDNVDDDDVDGDADSDAPSEYPSTQPGFDSKAGFMIHVDVDVDETNEGAAS